MWRAFFVAVGIMLCVVGGECLLIDKAVLASPRRSTQTTLNSYEATAQRNTAPREIKPPEWAPWSLISAGAVVLLYSATIRRNAN